MQAVAALLKHSVLFAQDKGVPHTVVGWLAEIALDRLDSMMGDVTDGVYADRAGEVAVRARRGLTTIWNRAS